MTKFDFDEDVIRRLAVLLDETGLTDIEIRHRGSTIRVAKGGGVVGVSTSAVIAAPAPANASGPDTPAEGDRNANHPGAVVSPMVGTVYTSPDPASAPFIQEGSIVEAGQTLLIIEAMKTMNSVTSPRAGTVTQILIENEQPVEFGQPLVIIE